MPTKRIVDTVYRRLQPREIWVLVFLLTSVLTSACQVQAPGPVAPTPAPTASPTLNFAYLPPIVAILPMDRTATPVAVVTSTPGAAQSSSQPIPTTSFNIIPPAPDTSWEACEEGPSSNLHEGDRASISYEPYLPTRVRTRPGQHTSSVLGLIIPGEVVEILEGPACVDKAVWWKVQSLRKNLTGWVQEGDEASRWLIRADLDSASQVPPPTEVPCPVTDDTLCSFVEGLKSPIAQGDYAEIQARTRVTECPPSEDSAASLKTPLAEGETTSCAVWGVLGSGLGGLDPTSIALIEPAWATYAAAPRKLTALLLPPYDRVQPALPPIPALFIKTKDPLWDWLFFIDEIDGQWQISALMMLSKESEAYPLLTEGQVLWP